MSVLPELGWRGARSDRLRKVGTRERAGEDGVILGIALGIGNIFFGIGVVVLLDWIDVRRGEYLFLVSLAIGWIIGPVLVVSIIRLLGWRRNRAA